MEDNSILKVTYTPREVQQLLGVGRNAVYEIIHANNLAINVGRKLIVPKVRLEKFLAGDEAA